MTTTTQIEVANPEAMQRYAERLGQAAKIGDVIALIGPLGSGKTTFAQGLARGLGVPEKRHVASPSFSLVNEHEGRVPFVHADLYRIKAAVELAELGLEEAFDRAVTAVEWADRFPSCLPEDHLAVRILMQGELTRTLELRYWKSRGQILAQILSG
jgi:tRNA threonylcarbamoyladenosine biosynthesis protein TsaE